VAVLLTLAVAGLGGWATQLGPWYAALEQPPWKPPDAAFGPAWTLIFTLTAWAAVRVWRRCEGAVRRRFAAALALNAALNVSWSVLFFTLHRPDWALAEVVLLWASVALLVVLAWPVDRRAALLLVPYLVWVAFAGALNAAVVQLNAPF
jgi:tryptophan-rich sensory protein